MLEMSLDGMSDQNIRADGRPMSLAISNSKNVVIKNFSVIQPQFWASIIIESENVLIQDFYVNATSYNPSVSDVNSLWYSTDNRQHTIGRAGWKTPMDLIPGGPRMLPSVRTFSLSCRKMLICRKYGIPRW
jgi:hypothetical protein